jgi:hypothetical protein
MLKAISFRAHGVIPLVFALSLTDVTAERDDVQPEVALAAPSSDIADLYAWLSNDTSKLNLVLTVSPNASAEGWFSSDVAYAFSISSSAAIGEPQAVTTISCKFADEAALECWGGDDYLLGDARGLSGISSDEGHIRAFAGRRNDPFFLESAGFDAAFTALRSGVADQTFELADEDEGCPRVTEAQGQELRDLLASGESGAAPSNSFAGQNVLALVLQVDRTLVDANGPVLGIWAGTYAAGAR